MDIAGNDSFNQNLVCWSSRQQVLRSGIDGIDESPKVDPVGTYSC